MFAWCCNWLCDSTGPGLPMKFPKKPEWDRPCHGVPKPILKPHSTQTIRTMENVAKVNIMLLIDHRFCITPPYSTARPGTLIKPTRVAAVICQEVSPGFSHVGASTGMDLLVRRGRSTHPPPGRWSAYSGQCLRQVCSRGAASAMAVRLGTSPTVWTLG